MSSAETRESTYTVHFADTSEGFQSYWKARGRAESIIKESKWGNRKVFIVTEVVSVYREVEVIE